MVLCWGPESVIKVALGSKTYASLALWPVRRYVEVLLSIGHEEKATEPCSSQGKIKFVEDTVIL